MSFIFLILLIFNNQALGKETTLKPFSFSSCNQDIAKNNWIRSWTKKVTSDCLADDCPPVELTSYEFLPAYTSKPIKILNEDDHYASSGLDFFNLYCELGMIHFSSSSSDGGDSGTSYVTIYDLVTNKTYNYTNNGYHSPTDGKYFVIISGRNAEQVDESYSESKSPMPVSIQFFNCASRKEKKESCKDPVITNYELKYLGKKGPVGISGTIEVIRPDSSSQFSILGPSNPPSQEIKQDVYLKCEVSKDLKVTCKPGPGYILTVK